jgi:hypothetical protein
MKVSELAKIGRAIDELREASAQIDGLPNMFTVRDLDTDEVNGMLVLDKELEVLSARISHHADDLERTWEMLDHDGYVAWLLTVPADSELFQDRRIRLLLERLGQL